MRARAAGPMADAVDQFDFVEDAPIKAAVRPRKRKVRMLTLDETIEVASDVLKSWRQNYLENMRLQKSKHSSKHERNVVSNNGRLFVWEHRGEVLHPQLQALFCRRANAGAGKLHGPTAQTDRVSPLDFDGSIQEEFGMAQPVIQSEDEVEVGRRAGTEDDDRVSARDSLLPWNISREGSQPQSASGARHSSLSAHTTPRSFSFMQTPILRPRLSSLLPSNRVSGIMGLGQLERVDSQGSAGTCRILSGNLA